MKKLLILIGTLTAIQLPVNAQVPTITISNKSTTDIGVLANYYANNTTRRKAGFLHPLIIKPQESKSVGFLGSGETTFEFVVGPFEKTEQSKTMGTYVPIRTAISNPTIEKDITLQPDDTIEIYQSTDGSWKVKVKIEPIM